MNMNPFFSGAVRQRGSTFIEIMVAVAISLFLLAGMIQVFASSKTTYNVQEGLSRIQEGGRFAVNALAREIRMIGYQGCINPEELDVSVIADVDNNGTEDVSFSVSNVGAGYNASGMNWSPALPGTLTSNLPSGAQVKAGTDVIELRGATTTETVKLTGNMNSDNANIQIDSNNFGFKKDDILFITDCGAADVFAATTVSSGGGKVTISHANTNNIGNRLSKAYGTEAEVMKFEQVFFYVRDNDDGNPALFRLNINGTEQELVEGVEDLQILFGIDNDGNRFADSYQTADAVTNWDGLVSVRLSLLLRTVDEVSPTSQPFTFLGTTVDPGDAGHPGDRRLRREFSTTISIRNRAVG